jgi:uncharacterized protein (TIGR00369 family)
MSAQAKLDFTREYQSRIPFVAHLGLVTEALGEGTARLAMALPKHFTNSLGTAHGGVILSLLDVALCTAARTLHPDSTGVVTIDLSASFVGGGKGEKLVAEARVLRDTRNMTFVEAEAKNADGSLVAKAIGTVKVRKADDRKGG